MSNNIEDQLLDDAANQLQSLIKLESKIEESYDHVLDFFNLLQDPDFRDTLEKMQLEENLLDDNLEELSYQSQKQIENVLDTLNNFKSVFEEWLEECGE